MDTSTRLQILQGTYTVSKVPIDEIEPQEFVSLIDYIIGEMKPVMKYLPFVSLADWVKRDEGINLSCPVGTRLDRKRIISGMVEIVQCPGQRNALLLTDDGSFLRLDHKGNVCKVREISTAEAARTYREKELFFYLTNGLKGSLLDSINKAEERVRSRRANLQKLMDLLGRIDFSVAQPTRG